MKRKVNKGVGLQCGRGGLIRRNESGFTLIELIIIIVVIISFVWFFSPDARMPGGRRGRANYGTIDGRPITMQDARANHGAFLVAA